jgi:hypothetical protein
MIITEELISKLLSLLTENANDIVVKYSNENGKEDLQVNGKSILEEKYDDSNIKEMIKNYKKNVGLIDDCLFAEISEELSNYMNLKSADEILDSDHYTENSAKIAQKIIESSSATIKYVITNKIEELQSLLSKF